MNSYDQAIADFFGKLGDVTTLFNRVNEDDYEEVAESIFKASRGIDNISKYRVFPEHDVSGYSAAKREAGRGKSMDVVARCKSGKKYLVGFNYEE
jgi:hypothetical protein